MNKENALRMKRIPNWLWPMLIIMAGLIIRVFAVTQNESPHINSYDTLRKVNLTFADQERVLSKAIGNWISADTLRKELYSPQTDTPNYKRLADQMNASNHPPLYYFLYHPIKIWLDNKSFRMISGYVFNLIIWSFASIVFFKLSLVVLKDRILILAALILYAFHLGSVGSILLLKGYVLQELFILLALLVYFKNRQASTLDFKSLFSYGFLLYCAFLTHYFSYVVVASFSVVIAVDCCSSKRFKKILGYGITTVASVILAVASYPNVIRDIMNDRRSIQIQENLNDYSLHSEFINAVETFLDFFINWPILIVLVLALSIWLTKSAKERNAHLTSAHLLVLFGLLAYLAIESISARSFARYVAISFPFLLIGIIYYSKVFFQLGKWTLLSLFALCTLFTSHSMKEALTENRANKTIPNWGLAKPIRRSIPKDASILVMPSYKQHYSEHAIFESSKGLEIAFSDHFDENLIGEGKNVIVLVHTGINNSQLSEIDSELAKAKFHYLRKNSGFFIYKRISNGS